MTHATLRRELGLPSAVFLGLGSMVGTGVFVGIALAAGVTGPSVLLAIPLAGFIALCNALSSAQLAAANPVSGGTYEYGYLHLTPALGFTAGWLFILAKVASASAACLGFAGYLARLLSTSSVFEAVPPRSQHMIAACAAAALTLLVLSGLRRSARINTVIVCITLLSLAAFVAAGLYFALSYAPMTFARPFSARGDDTPPPRLAVGNFLRATALMFVAFTGFGRLATLGEEVHEPRRTIPRAIVITTILCIALYLAVAFVAVGSRGVLELAEVARSTGAPLEAAASHYGVPFLPRLVALGACTAMLGVVLNLILGVSRVVLAMGRRSDLPAATARLNASRTSPTVAVALVGGAIALAAAFGGLHAAWAFSAFTVLVYYAITNAAALRLPREHRLYPRGLAWVGLAGCLGLAFFVEWRIWLAGLALIAIGLAWHAFRARRFPASLDSPPA